MSKINDIDINLEELNKEKEKNFQDRLKFIDWWVDYMKKKNDKEWSEHQNKIIDSQFNQ